MYTYEMSIIDDENRGFSQSWDANDAGKLRKATSTIDASTERCITTRDCTVL